MNTETFDRHIFRGKQLDNGEWVYGFYAHIVVDSLKGYEKHYIIPDYASALYGLEVDPVTVGQCTGLPDKTGVMVFEGDIVNIIFYTRPRPWLGTIQYRTENACFASMHKANIEGNEDIPRIIGKFGLRDDETLEIIGNRWDNPELLERGKP